MDKVVILIISHKAELCNYEQISLKQCYKILGHYPIKFICPLGLDVSLYKEILPNPQFDFIDPVWQSTYENFNRLKIDPFLYNRYKQYQYILFYEPDAFVFRDELEFWCDQGYDYIGAPLFENFHTGEKFEEFAGNGGFSLRKTNSLIKVLNANKIYQNPIQIIKHYYKNYLFFKFLSRLPLIFMKSLGYKNTFKYFYRKVYNANEDLFWVYEVPKRFPKFKLARYTEAIPFSFECQPTKLFALNQNKLPFGCHAWYKHGFDEFYSKHIKV